MRRVFLLLLVALLTTTTAAIAQNRKISGVVTDDKGLAVSAASIKVKGADIGTTTDAEGKYGLNIPAANNVLVVSHIEYVTREIAIGGNSSINISLEHLNSSLDQVVVTGYSSQKKKDITGSVAVVDMTAVKSVANGSALQALQGQASGVNIIKSGAPGASSNVFVRGISSFGNTSPLVLIDGVEGSLDNIPANEIQSVQVLKDAGAAAIYGVRGSNGVIVVTTKKGKSGAPVVTFSTYYGIQQPLAGNVFNLMNSEQIAEKTKEVNPATALFQNGLPDYMYRGGGAAGVAMEGDPAIDPSKYNLDPSNSANNYLIQKVNKQGTDWFHELFKTAPMQDHNISVSGGGNSSTYMLSLGYFDQQGTMLETYMKRYSVRMNSSFNIGKNIRIGENVSLIYKNYRDPVGTPISWTYRQMPVIPVYDIMGNFGGTFAGQELGASSSAVQVQKSSRNNTNQFWTAVGNVYAEVDFLKHFTARTSIGGRIQNIHNTAFTFTPYNNTEGNNNPNSFREGSSYASNTTWTNTLKYGNKFGDHSVEVIAGSEAIRNYGRSVSGTRQGYFSSDLDYLTLANGTLNVTNTSASYVNTLYSLFGRVDYSFKSKYLLGATIRRDGSSKFGTNNRYGVFPSVSVGWRLSDEEFMKSISWVNDLKLRASYGVLGSQNTVTAENAYNLFGGTFANAYYDLNGTSNSIVQGFYQTIMGNSATGWEEDIITNYGFDAAMLNNKVNVSVEYYKKSIKGLLFPKDLPATVGGATVPTVNVGDIQNKGWDVSAGYRDELSQDFGFRISANITTYKNNVVFIPGSGFFDDASVQVLGNVVRNQTGHEVSSFFGYDVVGLFQDAEEVTKSPTQTGAAPGRFKYRDVNGDGAITTADRTFIGSANPDFTYGFNIGVNFKNFDLSAIFYGSQGNQLHNQVRLYTDFFSGYVGGKSLDLYNAWTPENPTSRTPKAEMAANFSSAGTANSYYLEDGSYLRLNNLILGYNIPASVLSRVHIKTLRVYAQAANLFTITNYTGMDPEIGGSSSAFGVDMANYPNNQKSFIVGLNVSF